MWVRGLKRLVGAVYRSMSRSHPMWVRGLKQRHTIRYAAHRASHPMWVRGLKHEQQINLPIDEKVAPHVGAWIETPDKLLTLSCQTSHPMWVRGLKPLRIASGVAPHVSHPMWVRGLKQFKTRKSLGEIRVAPHVGAWIETRRRTVRCAAHMSHPMWVRGLKLFTSTIFG